MKLVHRFRLILSFDLLTSADLVFSLKILVKAHKKYTDPCQEISLIAVEYHQTNEGKLFSDYMLTTHLILAWEPVTLFLQSLFSPTGKF